MLFTKAQEIADGMQYLHNRGVIHGCLRLVRFLFHLTGYYLIVPQDGIIVTDQKQAQISDFGIAQILDSPNFMKMMQNNIRFIAPELMPTKETDLFDVRPTRQSDIFSFGMLLLQVSRLWYTLSIENST